ncbi:MAG: hypothetical protein K2L34_12550 [Muribaculaceae bacterium]|nr:hypothetical protein [Muribaculaceae bacterium]
MQRIYYLLLLSILLITGCEEERTFMGPMEVYFCEKNDTTLNAAQHDFIISMVSPEGNKPSDDWKFCNLQIWDNNKPDSLWYDHAEWGYYSRLELEKTPSSISNDWIKFEKINDSDNPKFRVIVQENTAHKPRTIRVVFGDGNSHIGHFIVSQKACPDMEPFEMKIRFKGKEYSTMAHLNIEEEIVMENPEFIETMNRIEAIDDIEAIVQEDGIVDYLDASDMEVKPTLVRLRQNIDASTRCNILPLEAPTRAKDAFRLMTANALGYYALFDDQDFSDSYYSSSCTDFNDVKDIDYMRDIGLNDKVTSLAVAYNGDNAEICAVLTVWEDSYFNFGDYDRTKHRISFIASKATPRISWPSLKKIKCMGSSNSWNDRISSFSFHFGYYDRKLKDY